MALDVLTFLGGLVLLLGGGEALVRGSAALAARLGVSPLIVGITVVGFGTSAPELVTSVAAALAGAPGIAVGNIVGSNIANILLILGTTALAVPVRFDRAMRRHGAGVLATALALTGLAWFDALTRPAGLVLLALLVLYLVAVTRDERRLIGLRRAAALEKAAETTEARAPAKLANALLLTAGGLALLVLGGRIVVEAAVALAAGLGVPQSTIGVTIVAIGTSLPEMSAGVLAALRGQPQIAVGNILGSNIYNVLGIGGATLAAAPVAAPTELLVLDIWIMAAASALLLAFVWSAHTISRAEGGLMVACYLGFVAYAAFG